MARRSMTIDAIERREGVLWRFDTARYTIAFWAEEEDLAPEDSFCDERDIAFAREDNPAHWFCAFVGVFERTEDDDGECLGYDVLGGCSYHSFREFWSMHRWQYSRRQGRYIENPRTRAWKACEARRPRREDGTRMDGSYFPQMVRQAISEARCSVAMNSEGARRA